MPHSDLEGSASHARGRGADGEAIAAAQEGPPASSTAAGAAARALTFTGAGDKKASKEGRLCPRPTRRSPPPRASGLRAVRSPAQSAHFPRRGSGGHSAGLSSATGVGAGVEAPAIAIPPAKDAGGKGAGGASSGDRVRRASYARPRDIGGRRGGRRRRGARGRSVRRRGRCGRGGCRGGRRTPHTPTARILLPRGHRASDRPRHGRRCRGDAARICPDRHATKCRR